MIMLKYLPGNLIVDPRKLESFYSNCRLLYCDKDTDNKASNGKITSQGHKY